MGHNKSAHLDRSCHILNRMCYIVYVVVKGLVTKFLHACLMLCFRDHVFTLTAEVWNVRAYSFNKNHSCSTRDTTEDKHHSPDKHKVTQRCKGISIIIEVGITSQSVEKPEKSESWGIYSLVNSWYYWMWKSEKRVFWTFSTVSPLMHGLPTRNLSTRCREKKAEPRTPQSSFWF